MFPRELVDGLWATKSEGVRLSVRAISFQDFQPMWSWSTNVTDGQTDGQRDGRTTCDRNTALCTKVHRAVMTLSGTVFIDHCYHSGIFISSSLSLMKLYPYRPTQYTSLCPWKFFQGHSGPKNKYKYECTKMIARNQKSSFHNVQIVPTPYCSGIRAMALFYGLIGKEV